MQVSNVMSSKIASCTKGSSLSAVARLMAEHDCGAIPVVEDGGRPIGIVSDRDIVLRTLAAGKDAKDLTAGDVMSRPCVSVSQDADFDACVCMMEGNKIRRVVVVDGGGKCVGIVSQADVALNAPKRRVGGVVNHISKRDTEPMRPRSAVRAAREHPVTVASVITTIGVVGVTAWYLRKRGAASLVEKGGMIEKFGEKLGDRMAATLHGKLEALSGLFA